MQNQDEISNTTHEAIDDDWSNYKDTDVMQQHFEILEQDAAKFPFVGDKVTNA